jgi:hypothetical protein
MELYAIAHTGDHQWVVSAEDLLVCKRKRDAVKATREAAELLQENSRE